MDKVALILARLQDVAQSMGAVLVDRETFEVPEGIGRFGQPIYGLTIFEEVEYDYLGSKQKTPELRLPICLISLSYQNQIVETPLNGRLGTIKEFIAGSDYSITFDASIISLTQSYPYDEVKKLDKIAKAKTAIPVANTFLNKLGIYEVIFKDYSVKQIRGNIGQVDISINAVSNLSKL